MAGSPGLTNAQVEQVNDLVSMLEEFVAGNAPGSLIQGLRGPSHRPAMTTREQQLEMIKFARWWLHGTGEKLNDPKSIRNGAGYASKDDR